MLRKFCGGLFFGSLIVFLAGGVWAEPVAPLLELTDQGLKLVKSQGKTVEDIKREIPSRALIGLPVYPASYFASHMEGAESSSGKMLPALNLVSPDPLERVKEWYSNNLDGWSFNQTYDLFHPEGVTVDMASLMEIPTIAVMTEDDPGFDLMFYKAQSIRSRIIIRYEPKP